MSWQLGRTEEPRNIVGVSSVYRRGIAKENLDSTGLTPTKNKF